MSYQSIKRQLESWPKSLQQLVDDGDLDPECIPSDRLIQVVLKDLPFFPSMIAAEPLRVTTRDAQSIVFEARTKDGYYETLEVFEDYSIERKLYDHATLKYKSKGELADAQLTCLLALDGLMYEIKRLPIVKSLIHLYNQFSS